jgi:hypothetical protein
MSDIQVERLADYLATAKPQFIDDDLMVVITHNAARAAANTIRRLTAERDAAHKERDQLREIVKRVRALRHFHEIQRAQWNRNNTLYYHHNDIANALRIALGEDVGNE